MPKKSRYTEEQIIHALREVDAGAKVQEVARKLGVTVTTFKAMGFQEERTSQGIRYKWVGPIRSQR